MVHENQLLHFFSIWEKVNQYKIIAFFSFYIFFSKTTQRGRPHITSVPANKNTTDTKQVTPTTNTKQVTPTTSTKQVTPDVSSTNTGV